MNKTWYLTFYFVSGTSLRSSKVYIIKKQKEKESRDVIYFFEDPVNFRFC